MCICSKHSCNLKAMYDKHDTGGEEVYRCSEQVLSSEPHSAELVLLQLMNEKHSMVHQGTKRRGEGCEDGARKQQKPAVVIQKDLLPLRSSSGAQHA